MIKQEIIHAEIIDTECADTRRIGAELEIWKKVEDMLALKGKHPDEVYVDLMVMFVEFIDKKYPTKKYPTEKSIEQKNKLRNQQVKK